MRKIGCARKLTHRNSTFRTAAQMRKGKQAKKLKKQQHCADNEWKRPEARAKMTEEKERARMSENDDVTVCRHCLICAPNESERFDFGHVIHSITCKKANTIQSRKRRTNAVILCFGACHRLTPSPAIFRCFGFLSLAWCRGRRCHRRRHRWLLLCSRVAAIYTTYNWKQVRMAS